jgi:hypothetical protein
MGIWFHEVVRLPDLALANSQDRVVVELAIVGDNANPQRAFDPDGNPIVSPGQFLLPADGSWEAELEPTDGMEPSGLVYRRTIKGPDFQYLDHFTVPAVQKTPLNVTAAQRVGGVVTLTVVSTAGYTIGEDVAVNLVLSGYDGKFTLTNVTPTTLVYSQAGGDLGTTTGTVGKLWTVFDHISDPPAAVQSVGLSGHIDKLHEPFVWVPAGWGDRWRLARQEASSRRVQAHAWIDSIGFGVATTSPRELGVCGLISSALRNEYGDGGTGWLASAYTAPAFRTSITGGPTGGSYLLRVNVNGGGFQDAVIPFNASAATLVGLIEGLSNVPAGAVVAIGGALPANAIAFNFIGPLAEASIQCIAGTNSLTGGAAPAPTVVAAFTTVVGMGGSSMRTTALGVLRYDLLMGTKVNIWYRNASITGSFRWRVNGGGFTTVTPPTAFSLDPGVVEIINPTLVGNGPHLLEIEWVSGTIDIFGVEAHYATGITVARLGQSGRAASDFSLGDQEIIPNFSVASGTPNVTIPAPGSLRNTHVTRYISGTSGPLALPNDVTLASAASATAGTLSGNATGTITNATVRAHTNPASNLGGTGMVPLPFLAGGIGMPDVVIIILGANDPAQTYGNADTYIEGVSRIIRQYTHAADDGAIDYTPDFIIVIEHIGTWFDLQNEFPAIAAAAAQLAMANNAVLIDMWSKGRRSHEYWQDLGYFADAIHVTDAGAVVYAEDIINLLTRVA